MKKMSIGVFLLILVFLVLTAISTEKVVSARYESEIIRLKGEVSIHQTQAENYAKALRSIREAAGSVSLVEKAQ